MTVPPGQPRAAAVSQVTHHGGCWLSVARLAGRAQRARPRLGRGPRQGFLADTRGSNGGLSRVGFVKVVALITASATFGYSA